LDYENKYNRKISRCNKKLNYISLLLPYPKGIGVSATRKNMKTAIKNASGRTVGYKVERGSQIIVEDAAGKVLGRFDGNTKKTLDNSGQVRYSGDQTSALLADD
jgi:hypothetical protein